MDRKTEQAYKRSCFQGRGMAARWLDRAFFALLGGVCLYLARWKLMPSVLLSLGLLGLFLLWDGRRWTKYQRDLWRTAKKALRREAWLREEAARIRQAGGTVLYPTPDGEGLTGHCLRLGEGAALHCFGAPGEELVKQAEVLGCTLVFHPWQEGSEPSREQVVERLRRDAPKRELRLWRGLPQLPGGRYLLVGCVLLVLSMVLRRALYWRLLGSLCLFLGAIRRALHSTR